MSECVVNASPLITLGFVGRIDVLEKLFRGMVIPQGVAEEIGEGAEDDPARRWLEGDGRRWVVTNTVVHPVIAGWDLGRGESEVLSWGYAQKDDVVILDDGAARKCAQVLGIPCRGTVGVLVLAKRQGLLDAVTPILTTIETLGFRMRPELIEAAKRLADE